MFRCLDDQLAFFCALRPDNELELRTRMIACRAKKFLQVLDRRASEVIDANLVDIQYSRVQLTPYCELIGGRLAAERWKANGLTGSDHSEPLL